MIIDKKYKKVEEKTQKIIYFSACQNMTKFVNKLRYYILRGDIVELPKRKRNRLKGYDYASSGAYFITICVYNKKCLFGTVGVGYA